MELSAQNSLIELDRLSRERGDPLYLVGGSVRDTLRGEGPVDLDFAGPCAPKMARLLANQTGHPLVPLDKTPGRETYRVVLDKNLFFDFTSMQGKTIEADLAQRDFTINAMALSLPDFAKGNKIPIDPFNGQDDLRNKIIRVVPGPAFEEDPLRLLRAFRFASTLGFTIEPDTLAQIKTHKEKLGNTARERVSYELLILLGAPHSHLEELDQTGLIEVLFPEIAQLKSKPGTRPNTSAWEDTRNAFMELENILMHPDLFLEDHAPLIKKYISENHHYALLKWSTLMRTAAGENLSISDITGILRDFRLSNADIQFIERTLQFSKWVLSESRSATRGFEQDPAVYRLVKQSGHELISSLLLSLAVRLGYQEDIKFFIQSINRILDFYIETYIPAQDRPVLLNGEVLKKRFKLSPSPLFKDILEKVEEARVLGTISTKEEAEQLARELISSH